MSSANALPENAFNKVLPGDKTGLPWEIWQYLLSWMSAGDLCRLARVCKTWTDLVISVDGTRWKQLYLACSEWRHPFWPLNTQAEPASWRLAYRDQYLATKFWRHRQQREARTVSCSLLFKKSVIRRTINVGPGLEHECLKTALSVINEYDRVVVHPGIYDELFEISSKIPFELVGEGELGSVILVVGIQQVGAAARLSNLVLRAPWFTSFIIMINSGYLQIDSCILEDGMICAQNPATVHIKFCTFRHATVILQHMNASIIENCEFSQSDSANVIVEGYPKEERNWTYGFLRERTDAVFSQKRSLHRKRRGLKATTSLTSSTLHSSVTGKSSAVTGGGWSSATTYRQQSSDAVSHDPSFSIEDPGLTFLHPNLVPGARFLMMPPDNTAMVGCGDLQSMYHDGTCGAAEVEQNLTQFLDGAKISSTSMAAMQNPISPSSHVLDKLKDGDVDETGMGKGPGMIRVSSTSGSQPKVVTSFSSPSEAYQERVDLVLSHRVCKGSKQDTLTTNNSNEQGQQEAWAYSNTHKDSPGPSIKIKTNAFEKERDHMACYEMLQSNEKGKLCFDISNKAPAQLMQTDKSQCNSLHETHRLDPESLQYAADTGRANISIGYTESMFKAPSLMCRTKQARRRQTLRSEDAELELGAEKQDVSTLCFHSTTEHSGSGRPTHKPISFEINSASTTSNLLPKSVDDFSHSTHNNYFCDAGPSREHTEAEISSLRSMDSLKTNPHELELFVSSQKTPSSSPSTSNQTETGISHNGTIPNCSHNIQLSLHANNGFHRDLGCPHQSSQSSEFQQEQPFYHSPHKQYFEQMRLRPELPPIHIPIRRSQSQELEQPVSDDDLSILDELGDSDESSSVEENSNHNSSLSDSSSSSSSITNSLHFSGSEESFATSEESVIMLPHLKEFHPEGHGHLNHSTTSPRGVQAEVASINSECTRPVPVDVSEDTLMSSYVGQIQGCLIHQCRMNHSKGGLMISLQAHAIVSECDISNVSYGIRCIQNSRAVILKNKIHHCRTSGIFMRLAASGLIAGNDIHSNNEAGIDIRKNADPLVQFNQIHHGKRSGVVVLGSGRGQIKKNDIYRNQEAGVYVLYGGNPTISENYIYEGKAAGVAINAGGRGCIIDNVIRGNQWGGVDIRNGSCPLVAGNSIINGLSDGVVVGLGGRGSIESNFISGNGGCGVWVMAATNLYIHGNQIANSGHCGVMMLNESASAMESHLGQLLTNVNHHGFSQLEDNSTHSNPKTKWATLQYNNVFNNNGHGVVIEIKEEVHMLYNAVHGNHGDGVLMSQCAPALLESNSITSNCGNGIVTSVFDKVQLKGNGIYDNGAHGLVCRTNCIVQANDIAGQNQASVLAQAGADVEMRENRLCSSASGISAIVVEESAVVQAANNTIFIIAGGGKDFNGRGNITSENTVLTRLGDAVRRPSKGDKGEFNKTDFLTDPPPRPHIVPPPPSTVIPSHYVTVVTKVTVPSAESCEQGSKFCIIL